MARFFLFLLGVLALAAGAADAYLGGAEHEKIVDRHATALLSASSRGLPLALESDESLWVVREVAQRTPFQFTLADFALQGTAPDASILRQAERALSQLAGEAEPVVLVGTLGGVGGIRAGEPVEVGEGAHALVQEALAGREAIGLASLEGKLFRVRAVPVASGALGVALPVDDAFARHLGQALGVELTFLHGGKVVASSLGTMERAELAVASSEQEGVFGAGARPEGYRAFEILELPLFTPWAGSMRALASESGEAIVLHSTSIRPLLDPLVELQKRSLLLSALVAVIALFFTLVGRGGNRQLKKLAQIVDLAERAAEGDAKVQAPEHLAGDLGRLSRALNRLASKGRRSDPVQAALEGEGGAFAAGDYEASAADLAASFHFPSEPSGMESESAAGPPPLPEQWAEAPSAEEGSVAGLDLPEQVGPTGLGSVDLPPQGEPAFGSTEAEAPPGFSTFGAPSSGPEEENTEPFGAAPPEGFEPSPLGDGAEPGPPTGFAMGPPADEEPEPAEQSAGEPWDMPTRPLPYLTEDGAGGDEPAPQAQASSQAQLRTPESAPALVEASAPPPAPEEPVDPEESHLREVYEEFLQIRQQCGESSAGISYERFSAKLRQNRAQLMEKYRCESVRFTVYVKEGKAALKASPIGVNRAS